MSISVRCLTDSEIKLHIESLARLRIDVFKEFPYIYDGSYEYEVKYLKKYLISKKAALIAAFDDNLIIGISSCLPLIDETFEVQKPFHDLSYKAEEIFYFGESVLQKKYRGSGLGKIFFQEREKWVKTFSNQYKITTFCAVEREKNHEQRPANYKPLDEFWISQGYQKSSQLQTYFSWQDIGESVETEKKMIFWLKQME